LIEDINQIRKQPLPNEKISRSTKITTQYDIEMINSLWKELLNEGLDNPTKLQVILKKLRRSGAGWVLYKEFADLISQNTLDDKSVSYIIKILTDAYEGGSFDKNTYQNPKNDKDLIIQSVMLQQLQNPAGIKSLKISLDLLYMLKERGDSRTELLEETLNNYNELLGQSVVLDYRLHYSDSLERLSEIINNLNNQESDKIKYAFPVLFKNIYSSTLLIENGLANDEYAQDALKTFLKKNTISFENYENLTISEQARISNNYANRIWLEGATTGAENLEAYILEKAQTISDPKKIIALTDFLASRIEITETTDSYDQLVKNNNVQTILRDSLNDANLPQYTRLKIKQLIQAQDLDVSDSPNFPPLELEEAFSSMSEAEKNIAEKQLKDLLLNENLSIEERSRIQVLIDNNITNCST